MAYRENNDRNKPLTSRSRKAEVPAERGEADSFFGPVAECRWSLDLSFQPKPRTSGGGAGDNWHWGTHHRVGQVLGSVGASLALRRR